ncbi:ATP synthase, F1 delta subunit [Synechococcus sp. PCC 7502]|uniref:ATP synthase F1 subunit delta n=1 Tax=Synechococcus sp. PCC 7502 TaxID=1173263 RepID=UPI00029F9932|nr:ATP synthase F1 subunit delta [Synechococcus sp. PCC 7502]AFY74730.1 ATP synthase, F1 delta subunit [Synechococcus sp. PCC 7502]
MKSGSFSQAIVEPYADALMAVAQEHNLVEAFGNDIQVILNTLEASEDFKKLLLAPLIPESVKKDLLNSLFANQVNPFIASFLNLLVERRRILFLEPICLKFQELLRKKNRIALAEISTAVGLSDPQKEALTKKVLELTGAASVELAIKLNPDLIGGVIIKVGSQVIDASLRGQLRRLTTGLLANI